MFKDHVPSRVFRCNPCNDSKIFTYRNVKTWNKFMSYAKCLVCGAVYMTTKMVKQREGTRTRFAYDKYE